MRPLLIGQAPGPNTDPAAPLHPSTSGTGRNLLKLMGIPIDRYLTLFHRTNLLHQFPGKHLRDDKFPLKKARIAAEAMKPIIGDRKLIFVGRNVALAFGYHGPFHEWRYWDSWDVAVVPHPSGRNRWYNDRANLHESEQFWRALIKTLDSGQ